MRAIAGMMKLQSGGTSTTLTSIVRASASWNTRTLSSVSAVAAKTRNAPSRSSLRYARSSSRSEPSRASCSISGSACSATTCTSASAASRPSTFSRPTGPAPTTRQRRPRRFRHVMKNGVSTRSRLHEESQPPSSARWHTQGRPVLTPEGYPRSAGYRCMRSATSSAVCSTRTPSRSAALHALAELQEAAGVAAHDRIDARLRDLADLRVQEAQRVVGPHQRVGAGRAAAAAGARQVDDLDARQRGEQRARLERDLLAVAQVARVLVGDADRRRGGRSAADRARRAASSSRARARRRPRPRACRAACRSRP